MKKIAIILATVVAALANVSCDNTKSYADLLNEENKATNAFLVNQRVVGSLPADTVFEVGPDAPFYQLDQEGNIFMQVLNAGTPGNKATYDQLIYMRFTRYSLYGYSYDLDKMGQSGYYGEFGDGNGNDSDMTQGSASFRFKNLTSNASYQWGEGLQTPLLYLPIDCEVNLVLKSQAGLSSEISAVTPYFYNIRYFKSQI